MAGEWSLQDAKGNAALDSSGHENHGRLHQTRWIQECRLQGFWPIQGATRTSMIEQDGQPASVTDGIGQWTMAPAGIETVRLQLVPPTR